MWMDGGWFLKKQGSDDFVFFKGGWVELGY